MSRRHAMVVEPPARPVPAGRQPATAARTPPWLLPRLVLLLLPVLLASAPARAGNLFGQPMLSTTLPTDPPSAGPLAPGSLSSQAAPPAPLNEQVLALPGDPARPVALEVTLYTPPGPGPFPLAVVNHGATNASRSNRGDRFRYTYAAYYFLSRGYAVALPMARGFAGSGGAMVGAGCALDEIGLANARDVLAVIQALGRRPEIDPRRIVVSGQSFGGWTTLALGALAAPGTLPGLRGLIAFSPALRSSDCLYQDPSIIAGAARFGGVTTIPSLWFYGDNDSIMPTATWKSVFGAYRGAGAQATLIPIGRFLQDSHQMLTFPESLPTWTVRVDAFLSRIGLPASDIHPEYLPIPTPPPTRFAAIGDVAAVPFLSDQGRAAYRHFLTLKVPRVFVLSTSGTSATAQAGFDPLARAERLCSRAAANCHPYAVDSDVVWTSTPAPVLTRNSVVAAGQPSRLAVAVSVRDDCSAKPPPMVHLIAAPMHGEISVLPASGHPRFPPGSPRAVCNAVTVPGIGIVYTPAAGYAGPDRVGFTFGQPGEPGQMVRISLLVTRAALQAQAQPTAMRAGPATPPEP